MIINENSIYIKTDDGHIKQNISVVGNRCVGCRSCEIVCPKKCIHMEENTEGFLFPQIYDNDCIKCGLCVSKCSQMKERLTKCMPQNVYAVKHKNRNELRESASGGAADVAAKIILSKKGIVFGAAYDEELEVRHIAIEKDDERYKLRSSKYVQSDVTDCFVRVKAALDLGRFVLFTGTPCQVDSLYTFLGKDYANLYTIDLVCHGVPSPKMFKKYIEYMCKIMGEKVLYYNFRSKEKKGWGTQYYAKTKTKTKTKTMALDPYGYHFLQSDCYRECCYSCSYANLNRPGDLTLGDFWGVEKYHPDFFSWDGVSEVLVNTDKGVELFSEMQTEIECIPIVLDEVLYKNGNLRHPSERPKRRNTIYLNIQDEDYIEKLDIGFQWKIRLKTLIPRKLHTYLKRFFI